jgi:hypothetical protein
MRVCRRSRELPATVVRRRTLKTRRRFLLAFFELLDQKDVPYCVLRNYENVYEDASSDVDIVVEPAHLESFKQCLDAAAAASGCAFIHQARYTNHSFVYRHPQGTFVRVDVETEVRWRVFPVLSASTVIKNRRKYGAFYIPHPIHESVILFVASIWRGCLKSRYRDRLAALAGEIEDAEEFSHAFRAGFGRVGSRLEAAERDLRTFFPSPTLWRCAKCSIVFNTLSSNANIRAFFGYIIEDLHRFRQRLRNPPGISLLYICVAGAPNETPDLFKRMEFLFPMQKLAAHCLRLSPGQSDGARLGLKGRLRRLFTLFKGGIFLRYYEVSNDAEVPRVAGMISRFLYPSRAFFCAQTSRGFWMGHAQTRFMTDCPADSLVSSRHDELIRFITGILMHNRASVASASPSAASERARRREAGDLGPAAPFLQRFFSFPRLASIGLALMLIGTLSFLAVGRLKGQAKVMANEVLPGLSYAGAANASLANSFNRTLMLLLCEVPEQREQLQKEIDVLSQKTSAYLEAYQGQIVSAEDQALLDTLVKHREQYLGIRDRTLALAEEDRSQALLLYRKELLPAYQHYKEAGDALFDYNSHLGTSQGQSILALCGTTQFVFWGVGITLFLGGFAVGIYGHVSLVWLPQAATTPIPAENG